ncbi:MAG: porin [Aestuariivirga sp.]
MKFRTSLAAAALLLAAAPSEADDECGAPCVGYSLSSEVQGDFIVGTDPAGLTGDDIEPSTDLELFFKPIDRLKIVSTITTESVLDPLPGEDRVFEDIGGYVSELYAEADFEPVTLRWGKFDPQFGLATNTLDGIYATDLLGDYDSSERWAVESVLDFEAFGLSHAITASAFTTDRTFLSNSIITRRGKLRLSDGGAGNNRGIPSFALLLDGCLGAAAAECYADGRFGYRFGVRYQKAGRRTAEQIEDEIILNDETGFLAAGTARFEIDPVTLRFLSEFAYFDHFEGEPDDVWYATVSAAAEIEPVTLAAAYTRQRTLVAGGPDTKADLVDITASYDLGEDFSLAGETWKIAAAYRYRQDEGVSDHTIGLKLSIGLEGSLSLAGGGE